MAREIKDEYLSSLGDLTLNSKPLINMLTIVAEDNIEHANVIVEAVEEHLAKVPSDRKLPILYLIDSIVKNVGGMYTTLFTQNIVSTFCSVFQQVDERVRGQMFKLRQTWNEVFPSKKMLALDVRVQDIDPAWPITAPPCIHLNPKFLNKSGQSGDQAMTSATPAAAPAARAPPDVPVVVPALNKLISKQQELLALQQRKVELELLHAKVKLQEQSKQFAQTSSTTTKSQDLLELQQRKVELELLQAKAKLQEQRKQFTQAPQVAAVPSQTSLPSMRAVLTKEGAVQEVTETKPLTNKTIQTIQNAAGTKPAARISPASSALVNAVRPAPRDPRLVKTTSNKVGGINNTSQQNTNNVECVNNNKQKPINNSTDCSNNKIVNNKLTVTKDPRLLNKSRREPHQSKQAKSGATCAIRKPRSDKNSAETLGGAPRVNTDRAVAPDGKTKPTREQSKLNRSSSSSPTKAKKKERHSSSSPQKPDKRSPDKRAKPSLSSTTKPVQKYDPLESDIVLEPSPPPEQPKVEEKGFKELKGSTKSRNYMRRNRTESPAPERAKEDVDLRVVPAPPTAEVPCVQTPNIRDEIVERADNQKIQVDVATTSKDVDLRQFPAVVGKKRPSTENFDQPTSKKSKTELMDVLFGSEDVDLRTLPPVQPPTPPPPIISSPTTSVTDKENGWAKVKETQSPTAANASPGAAHLASVRAKLANATNKDRLGRPLLYGKLPEDPTERKRTLSLDSPKNDVDLRQPKVSSDIADQENIKIILSQAEEQHNRGHISSAQYNILMKQVIQIIETQKLREAQRKESDDAKSDRTDSNTSLTPISDDELSADFSHSESEDQPRPKPLRKPKRKHGTRFKDKDDRVPGRARDPNMPSLDAVETSMQNLQEQPPKRFISKAESRIRCRDSRFSQAGPNKGFKQMNGGRWGDLNIPPGGPVRPWDRNKRPAWVQGFSGPWKPSVNAGLLNQHSNQQVSGYVSMPFAVSLYGTRNESPPPIESHTTRELPDADRLVLDYINNDTMRTINIDGIGREIRYYGETAVVFMAWDDPREISFQAGSRRISFDDKESFVLSFNEPYQEVMVDETPVRIRLGAPSRELYVEDRWYECFFGGPGVGIEIGGKLTIVKLDGPPPQVKIGIARRTDLVIGRINLIIDACTMVPVFLDAKPQKFDIEGKVHTLRFVDALRTVLINEIPFRVEFGGLPKPIYVNDKKHFIRFSTLPQGFRPGYVDIKDMEGEKIKEESSQIMEPEKENEAIVLPTRVEPVDTNEPALPMLGKKRLNTGSDAAENGSPNRGNSPARSVMFIPPVQQSNFGWDILSSVMPSSMAPSSNINSGGYRVEPQAAVSEPQSAVSTLPKQTIPGLDIAEQISSSEQPPALGLLPSTTIDSSKVNIEELFQKLVASGIVNVPVKETKTESPIEMVIKPVKFEQPETLKIRQQSVINALYSGMQCSSCGTRFPPEHTMKYSQHLDWHFRQNRRERHSVRKANSRKWFYDVSDWIQFEEIEDLEEREKNWFESQQAAAQELGAFDREDGGEEGEVPSVEASSVGPDPRCEVCREHFDQFFNEEKEEWHLRMAIKIDDKLYHPVCYEDYKPAICDSSANESAIENVTPDDVEMKVITLVDSKDDDTDKSEVKIEIDSDELPVKTEDPSAEEPMEEDEDDDDVQIVQRPPEEPIDVDAFEFDDEPALDPNVVVKTEPVDPVEFVMEEMSSQLISTTTDTTHTEVISSIDGNVQLESTDQLTTSMPSNKIKINISKPLTAAPAPKESADATRERLIKESGPSPPGEEPVREPIKFKPGLQGRKLTKLPPVQKGTELSGLCSIM